MITIEYTSRGISPSNEERFLDVAGRNICERSIGTVAEPERGKDKTWTSREIGIAEVHARYRQPDR